MKLSSSNTLLLHYYFFFLMLQGILGGLTEFVDIYLGCKGVRDVSCP